LLAHLLGPGDNPILKGDPAFETATLHDISPVLAGPNPHGSALAILICSWPGVGSKVNISNQGSGQPVRQTRTLNEKPGREAGRIASISRFLQCGILIEEQRCCLFTCALRGQGIRAPELDSQPDRVWRSAVAEWPSLFSDQFELPFDDEPDEDDGRGL